MMKCPVDSVELLMTTRNGVEIDYCPQCRGVWLDRGELDKLIEREEEYVSRRAAPLTERTPAREVPREAPRRDWDDDDDDRRSQYYDAYGKPKKKRSLLGEVFDIFD